MKRAGITATVRVIDAVQYDRRRIAYDYDMIEYRWDQSLSPGNEQQVFFGSAGADLPGSRNYPGIRSAAVDALTASLGRTVAREDLLARVHALDRVLCWGYYVVPLYYLPVNQIASWAHLHHPAVTPLTGVAPETWWIE